MSKKMSKKNEWKDIKLDFQFGANKAPLDWSAAEEDTHVKDLNEIRSSLPTQTNATRQTDELNNISEDGPFVLCFANIPFDATEEDLREYLQGCQIDRVVMNDRKRGSGWLEFSNLNNLALGLNFNDKFFKGRPIRLNIATSDDIDRMNGLNVKSRSYGDSKTNFSSIQPGAADDSDNWRVRKTQPVVQTPTRDNENSFKRGGSVQKGSNWRPRNTQQPTTSQPPVESPSKNTPSSNIDDIDNWRRGKNLDLPKTQKPKESKPVQDLAFVRKPPPPNSKRDDSPKVIESNLTISTKVNIFGNAKPIDTREKEREIDEKLEKLKIQVEPNPKSESSSSAPRPNAWNTAKSSSFSNKSDSNSSQQQASPTEGQLEWRTGSKPPPNQQLPKQPVKPRETTNSIHKSETINQPANITAPKVEEKKKVPEPAPRPAVNVWEERKKSKLTASKTSPTIPVAATPTNQTAVKCIDNNNSSVSQTCTKNITPSSNPIEPGSIEEPLKEQEISTPTSTSASVIQKQPVVISANGPFLDPKSHKTQQQSQHFVMDNTYKLPKVVPKTNKASSVTPNSTPTNQPISYSSLTKDVSQVVTKATTNSAICKTNPQSSWAKGPPKTLVEKFDQNPNTVIQQ